MNEVEERFRKFLIGKNNNELRTSSKNVQNNSIHTNGKLD